MIYTTIENDNALLLLLGRNYPRNHLSLLSVAKGKVFILS